MCCWRAKTISALVLRRGPAKWVAALAWNRGHDTFALGQWLKGQIDEDTSDLSPDGRHFLYHAKKYEPAAGGKVSCTVMSRAPYLKALHYWAPKHRILGGAFFNNTRFWLRRFPLPEIRSLPQFEREKYVAEVDATTVQRDIASYRRERDGWGLQPDDYQRRNLWHKAQDDWTLSLSIPKRRDKLPAFYELKQGTDEVIPSSEWTWADLDRPRNRLCFARDGGLWSLDLKAGAKETLLHDFNEMQFEPRVAPY